MELRPQPRRLRDLGLLSPRDSTEQRALPLCMCTDSAGEAIDGLEGLHGLHIALIGVRKSLAVERIWERVPSLGGARAEADGNRTRQGALAPSPVLKVRALLRASKVALTCGSVFLRRSRNGQRLVRSKHRRRLVPAALNAHLSGYHPLWSALLT